MRVAWLALVVLTVGELLLLVHRCRCHRRAAILAEGRVGHGALGLESGSHAAAAHVLLVRAGVVHLGRLAGHALVVLRRKTAAASTAVGRVASVHVCVAHVAVRRLGGFAAQVLSLGE